MTPQQKLSRWGFLGASAVDQQVQRAQAQLHPQPSVRPIQPDLPGDKVMKARFGKDTKFRSTPAYPGEKPVGQIAVPHSKDHPTGILYVYEHKPTKAMSEEDVQWANISQAAGGAFEQAANPRLAALHSILGGITGVTPTVDALRSHNYAAAGVNAAMFLPFGRLFRTGEEAARGATAAVHAVRAAGGTREEIVRAATRAMKQRVFRVNNLEVAIPAAGSRTGSAMEGAVDAARGGLSRAGFKNQAERAGSEYAVSQSNRMKSLTNAAQTLRKIGKHLDDTQQYTLRILGEGVNPLQRIANHETLITDATVHGSLDEAAYHGVHSTLIQQALKKYIDVSPDGVPMLKPSAPAHLHQAWELLQEVASQRENLYRNLGLLNDQQIMERIQAPGRVVQGARYIPSTDEIAQRLESSPGRQLLQQRIEQYLPEDQPAQKALLSTFDAMAMQHAQQNVGDPLAVEDFYNRLIDVHMHDRIDPSRVPESINMLYQGDHLPADLPPSLNYAKIARSTFKAGHALPSEISDPAALRTAIRNVYNLARAGAEYRDWYDRAAAMIQRAAANEGVTPAQMAQLTAIYSQSANPMANMAFAVKAIREQRQLGAIKSLGAGGKAQRQKAQDVLEGKAWEGRKTNSFYQNILESINPAEASGKPVTVDRWVIRMFAPEAHFKGAVPKHLYNGIEHIITQMADQLGWTPKEVQAAAWVTAKARGLAERYPKRPDSLNWREAGDAYEAGVAKHSDQASLFDHFADTPPEDRVQPDHLQVAADAAREPDGGFTLNRSLTPDHGTRGFMVALAPYEERVAADSLTPEVIMDYRNRHLQALKADSNLRVGGWHNPEDGQVYLDISRVVPTKEEALKLARKEGQLSVFDREAALVHGKWDTAFPESGLSAAEADAIKAGAKATAQFTQLLERAARVWGLEGKLTKQDLVQTERRLLDWADANRTDPYGQQVLDLYGKMHAAKQSPDPELLFQEAKADPMLEAAAMQVTQGGMSIEDAAKMFGKSVDELRAHIEGGGHAAEQARILSNADVGAGAAATTEDAKTILDRAQGKTGPDILYQGVEDFGDAARNELANQQAFARDIKATLPESEWPQWVKNIDRPRNRPVDMTPAEPKPYEVRALPDETPDELASRQAAVNQDYMIRHQEWKAAVARRQAQEAQWATEDAVQSGDIFPPDWLSQRAHSGPYGEGIDMPYAYKGAIQFTPQGAVMHLTERTDVSTFVHEMAHFARRYLVSEETPGYGTLAKEVGLKIENEAERAAARRARTPIPPIRWSAWDVKAEEKFARMFESWVRTGRAPQSLSRPISVLSHRLRDIYEHSDLPDVPPEIARFFDKLVSPREVRGGKLIGAEDFHAGVAYIPYVRGIPQSRNALTDSTAAYFRRAQSALFGRSDRAAIGAGPTDKRLRKAFKGNLLLQGNFKINVTDASAESLMVAARLSAARTARADLLKAATDLPLHANDVAIKIDPNKDAPQELAAFFDKLHDLDAEGKLDSKALDGIDLNLSDSLREALMPSQLDGVPIEKAAAQAIESNTPIDNIKWIPRDFIDKTMLRGTRNSTEAWMEGLNKTARMAVQGAGMSFDAVNDIAKAVLLYLNPAYAPVNLAGNLVMNLMHQGPFMFINLWKSVMLHRDLDVRHRVLLDSLMGHGVVTSLITQGKIHPAALAHNTIGRALNLAVDFLPRRAAFLHEAAKLGFDNPERLRMLLDDTDRSEAMLRIRDYIARRANDAIVDYDRMGPIDKAILNRVIFFYPWLKGATRYTNRFIVEHPYQAMGLAVLADHAYHTANQQIGDRPDFLSETFPISTDALGARIPIVGLDLGSLADVVGSHKWTDSSGRPMTINVRQAFTMTSPIELIQSGIAFASGDPAGAGQLVQNLTPVLYAGGVSLFGKDPFKRKDVPQGAKTFYEQLFGAPPIKTDIQRLTMTPKERAKRNEKALYPRSAGNEAAHMVGGGLTPTPINTVTAAGLAAQASGDSYKQQVLKLKEDAKSVGLQPPPKDVLEDLQWRTKLTKAEHGTDTYAEKLQVAAKVYADRTGDKSIIRDTKDVANEAQAREFYYIIRDRMFARYNQYYELLSQGKVVKNGG